MGPLAGVGDPIFWGTARPVLAALGASLALNGSIVGPLLFFVGINLLRVLTRWYGLKFGYERGTEMVTEVGGGQLKKITQMAAIMGLFVMGALVSKWTTIKFPTVVSKVADPDTQIVKVTTVQSILDQLLPGLAALGLTFLCMWLLNKKVNALWIILGMFVIGILGAWTGWLGAGGDPTGPDAEAVLAEVAASRLTERGATRADDRISEAGMEDRKKEGYF